MRERGQRRTLVGVVTSTRMQKTVVIEVQRQVKHAMYKKYVRRRKRYKAHDESETCGLGDTVEIVESRPLSASKHWAVRRVMKRAE